MKKFILLSLFFAAATSLRAQTVITDSVIQTGTCAGSTIIVRYHTTGTFSSTNKFTAQLSNGFGQFTAPLNIGTINFNLGIIPATIPASAGFGIFYRVRVVATSPAVTGSESPNTILVTSTPLTATINAQPGTVVCPGHPVTLSATLPNATYLWSTGATTQAITVSAAGSYSVKVTDPLGCDARDTVAVTAVSTCTTGIYGPAVPGLQFFPNPVRSNGTLQVTGLLPQGAGRRLRFIAADGRCAASFVMSAANDLSPYHLSPGIYSILLEEKGLLKLLGRIVVR
jgi:hypothetical protein